MDKDLRSQFETVYRENFKYIYNYIYMRVLHRETAEDLCSKAFLNACAHFDSFELKKEGMAGVRNWLCRIARNCVIDHIRSKANTSTVLTDELPEIPATEDDQLSKRAINEELKRLLSMISDDEREIISMRFYLEMKVKNISEILGITENAASHRIVRTLEKLRKIEERSGNRFSDFIE